ncbi:MAG: tetratricopeptide repeat protein [Muribaculaceae bacterium]|nr:tetratricopeptide repeat protein [Muribaculaceae bacterium]
MLDNKQYDDARKILEGAIASEPNNANIYFMLGILEECLENYDAALANHRKAVDLDPSNAQYKYNVGRVLCNKAIDLDNAAKLKKYQGIRYQKQAITLFREAAPYLEEAYKLNPDVHDALIYLILIYNNLNDEANLRRIENLRNKLSEIQKR